ncbi:hypothetical protein A167_02638 [Alcanivorax sp. S71-1-4]|uniref:hypothetical protein n=1 Tax=Alcanivorax sp. S71-1-4 TaxID=1177159 RepID=UPI001356BD94|nr:hypothetical protein [Alcanivorax sp. S71-1-4]KAF0808250.1 hypothetical protein A167_02638 [Alcanivorax sp. S71-1-4]
MNENQRLQQIIRLRRKAMWVMVVISLVLALVLGAVQYGHLTLAEGMVRYLFTAMMSTGFAAVVFMVMLAYVLRGWGWALVLLVFSMVVPVVGLIGIVMMNFQATMRLRALQAEAERKAAALAAADEDDA